MNYTKRLKNVTVLGAAGKMGSGILLLTAIEMFNQKQKNKDDEFVLNAMDLSEENLKALLKYVEKQTRKAAEKRPEKFCVFYPNAKNEQEIADNYSKDVLSLIKTSTDLDVAANSTLIFEAVSENPKLKIKIFTDIEKINKNKPWYFTNTSSVPIHFLDEKADLGGRIIGFHFYNPPAIQKLVELITTDNTLTEAKEFAKEYAKNLRKVVVPSNDVAGFIGNGHFMRDALHAIHETKKLSAKFPFFESVYMMNKVSKDFLIRPMGIFQLIDYVGIDVVQFIMNVMNPRLENEDLQSDLLDKMIHLGVKGGQNADGSQKDGFLKYEKGRVVAIYDFNSKSYQNISNFKAHCNKELGNLPESFQSWKAVNFSENKTDMLNAFFSDLSNSNTRGAELAKKYNSRSREIGKKLVADGVAHNENDVNKVMLTGFYHAYGPINDYLI